MKTLTQHDELLVKPYIDSKIQTLTNQVKDMNNVYGSKNLLPNNNDTQIIHGVTFTPQSDGSIIVNGTQDGTGGGSYYHITDTFEGDGDYIINGCPSDGSSSKYRLYIWDNTSHSEVASDVGNGATATLVSGHLYTINIMVGVSQTVSNLVFKPMIRLASITDDTYEPYAKTNQQLTQDTTGLLDNTEVNGAVNMLPNEATSQVINGITFTVNDDGTVTADGTATANANFELCKTGSVELGLYKLSGCPSGGSENTYCLLSRDINNNRIYDIGEGIIATFPISTSTINIKIGSGVTVSNLTFKPMISVASYNGDYVPYAKSNKELTEDVASIEADITPLLNTVDITNSVAWNTYFTDGVAPSDYSNLTTQQATDIAQGMYDLMKKLFGTTSTGCRIIQVDRVFRDAGGTRIGSSNGLALIQMSTSYNTMLSNNDSARFSIMFLPYGVAGSYNFACWGKKLRANINVQASEYTNAHGIFTYDTISTYKG